MLLILEVLNFFWFPGKQNEIFTKYKLRSIHMETLKSNPENGNLHLKSVNINQLQPLSI